MSHSIFNRVYSYRERETKNSKENFLIEIFAHCLEIDTKFLTDFLCALGIENEERFSIDTQVIYEYGRPDLEINLLKSGTCILIECKVEHFERENQLDDYIRVLKEKNEKHKHLVYLTKYYESRDIKDDEIGFHTINWSDIYKLIDDENHYLTTELKNYLKEENMDDAKNFDYNDIVSLLNIYDTIKKMDAVIESVKDYYENKIGKLAKDSSRSTRMQQAQWYVANQPVGKAGFKFDIQIGFVWWWEDVYLIIRVWIPKGARYPNSVEYYNLIKNNLNDWESEDEGKAYVIQKNELVSKFIVQSIKDESDQLPKMREFFQKGIDELESLKKKDKNIFN